VGDYEGWPLAKSVLDVWPSFLIVAGLIGLTVWGLVRGRSLAFLGVWFFAILAPTSSFRPILREVVAERRMYLPLAAVIVLAVLGGRNLLRRLEAPRVAGTVLVAISAVALGWTTVRRNEDYRSTLSFWTDVVAKRPDNWRARMWLGDYYFKNRNSPAALPQLQEAVRLDPRNGSARYSLGIVLASLGKTQEAIEQFHEAVRSDPAHVRAHYNFALALMRLGRNDEAIEQLGMALRLDPNFKPARQALVQLGASR
jgi:tetratricopeptide (TPR) repeat protein